MEAQKLTYKIFDSEIDFLECDSFCYQRKDVRSWMNCIIFPYIVNSFPN
jgi:hypothetical protein